jgi:hypothetical protein
MTRISKRVLTIASLFALGLVLLMPSAASAGTYTVYGTCGLWGPYGPNGPYLTTYPACPQLVARNVGGAFTTPAGTEGGWIFYAPSGTSIAAFALEASLLGLQGWQAAVIPTGLGIPIENCPGSSCPGAQKHLSIHGWYPGYSSGAIVLRLRCPNGGCPNNTIQGYLGVTASAVTLNDGVAPGIAITGGSLVGSGWQRGGQVVTYNAADNAGIKLVRAFLDGQPRGEELRACNYALLIPCPNGPGALGLDTTGMADGAHQLAIQAVDAGDNVAYDSRVVYTDNTPPAAPGETALDGDGAWKETNRFSVQWRNPPQSASPIAAADYRLCPATDTAGSSSRCVAGSRSGSNLTKISDLAVPGEGDWTLRVALRDAAGNVNLTSAAVVKGLRFDATAPEASFEPMSPDDPTRVRVTARDATAGIAREAIEIQREGTNTWTELPVTSGADGFSTQLDDGQLPDGRYSIRAHVTDAAGNVRTITQMPDGSAAALALPIRIKTRLAVGRSTRVRARSSRSGKKRYKRILVTRPRSRYGRTVRISGRLTTPGANPVVGSPVEVWELVDLPGAVWTRISEIHTSRTGRFVYKALRGPSRLLRFHYSGTPTIRSRTSTVDLRVKATSSFRVNRHHVLNGESVTFRGRLAGLPLPPGGKLVELQVYSRRQWRTFGSARADAATGLWAFPYRFEAITGRVRFQFRARIRREATYPFELGTSRRARVTVRG